jgi:hypothetical protein
MPVAAIVLFLGVVAWRISIPPSHDRNWRPEVAVMPRATIDGDRVRITGVRNFDELRRRSLINAAAQAADGAPDFSERIRASLPTTAR